VIPLLMIGFGLLLAGLTGYALLVRWRAEQQREAALTGRLDAMKANVFDFDQNTVDPVDAWVATLPLTLRVWIGAADVRLRRDAVFAYIAAAAIIVILLARFFNPIAALIAIPVLLVAPVLAVRQVAMYRLTKFAEALPYFLDSLRQLLIVGNSFQQSFVRSVESGNPAVRRYLDPAMRRIRNGAAVPDAISAAADRVASVELQMLASAVRMNLRFGGAIGPVLSDLADLLRTRARVGRELRSATAEIRLSGLILSGLPVVAIILLSFLDSNYIGYLWNSDLGRKMLAVAAGLELTGILIMRRLTRLDF
jgi:tight adherence protein B